MRTMEAHEKQSLLDQQHGELIRFSKVAHILNGVAALIWLPGMHRRFDGVRSVRAPRPGEHGTARPVALKLEVKSDGSLEFSGAVSRAAHGKLRYRTIFRHDFSQPMQAGGVAVNPDNTVLARRAIGLLRSLVRFGERRLHSPRSAQLVAPQHPMYLVPFPAGQEQFDEQKLTALTEGMQPELVEAYRERLRQELCDRESIPGFTLVNCAIVPDEEIDRALSRERGYEDYSPVLGVGHWNPIAGLHEMPNPAESLLAKHGVADLNAVTAGQLDALAADFRQTLPLGGRLQDDEIFDALCHPNAPVRCAAGVEGFSDAKVVRAMRQACGDTRAAWEATDADLLRAARNPSERLILSRLSVTQIVAVDDLHALPAPYAGDFLPPLDWEPPRFSARRKAA